MRAAGSLWSVPVDQQAEVLRQAVAAGLDRVHWDSTDGDFAAAGGFTPESASALLVDLPPIAHEAHLMMHDPRPVLADWARFCDSIIVPVEIEPLDEVLGRIDALGVRPGVAVSLPTPLDRVPEGFTTLVMSITPGQAGAPFDPVAIDRVAALRARDPGVKIGVDGGVGPAQFLGLGSAGASWVVSGGSLFSSPDIAGWLHECEDATSGG